MAVFNTTVSLDELAHHADHGSNYPSIMYTHQIGATPSTGDSCDNTLTETIKWAPHDRADPSPQTMTAGRAGRTQRHSSTC